MNKLKYVIMTLLFIIPSSVSANCEVEEKTRLKNIISNINISYDYEIVNNDAVFSIKFNNLNPELYFRDMNENTYFTSSLDNGEMVLNGFADGKSYSFSFHGVRSCSDVGSLYVTLPKYNPFYQLKVCEDAQEYKLCQKWVSHDLNRKEFYEKVEEYKKNKNVLIDDTKAKKEISVIDFVGSFIKMYGLYITIVIAVIIIVVKFIRYKKDTFGF